MILARVGERAIPVLWKVIKTEGEIGFPIQKELLKALFELIPEGYLFY